LCLPCLRTNQDEPGDLKCGCEVESCANPHCGADEGAVLDPTFNHAFHCHRGLTSHRAALLETELERAYRKAGGKPDRQPSTRNLLGKVFDAVELAALFPGGLSKEQSQSREEVAMQYLHQLPSLKRDAEIKRIRASFPSRSPQAAGVIRFDLRLPGSEPADAPRELWLDHAIVHETSDSYRSAVLADLRDGKDASWTAPFKKAEGEKTRRFSGLMRVAQRLAREGYLAFTPCFLFPVISSLGSMNSDMTKLVKWIIGRYKGTLKSAPLREDGMPKTVLLGRFSLYVRRALCFALVRGNALALSNQGRPDFRKP
jgi:hypothetical protein